MKFLFSNIFRWVISILALLPLLWFTFQPLWFISVAEVVAGTTFFFVVIIFWSSTVGMRVVMAGKNYCSVSSGKYIFYTVYVVFYHLMTSAMQIITENSGAIHVNWIIGLLFVFSSLLFLRGMIYIFYAIAKSLAALERQHKPTVIESVATLLQLLVFPFSIWYVQKRINRQALAIL